MGNTGETIKLLLILLYTNEYFLRFLKFYASNVIVYLLWQHCSQKTATSFIFV